MSTGKLRSQNLPQALTRTVVPDVQRDFGIATDRLAELPVGNCFQYQVRAGCAAGIRDRY